MNIFESFLGKKVAIISGGTGGHVIPAINLAKYLEATIFVNETGSRFTNKYENTVVFQMEEKSLFQIIMQVGYFLFTLRDYDVIVGFGAFMCVPALIAGKILGKEVYTHEQNAVLGEANKILKIFGVKVLESFSMCKKDLVSGMPTLAVEKFTSEDSHILVMAGSSGSVFFDTVVFDIVSKWAEENNQLVYFQSKVRESTDYVKCYEFNSNIIDVMKNAKFIISRAGAASISELTLLEKKAILIPLANARQNHQLHNAKLSGFAYLEQKNVEKDLFETMNKCLYDENFAKKPSSMKLFVIDPKKKDENDENNSNDLEN